MTTSTQPLTIDTLIARYAEGIAFVADEPAATTVSDFIDQLGTAAENFDMARFDTDGVNAAATYLADANASTDDTERTVLLKRAADNLVFVDNLADEYRDMC
ncbi:hypothetical protein OG369_42840 [Streptomyces sp. NBC_01221]|uniref:hypothetical protein n=1 Tax=Streptomyces sp. NBC_01221 TaxID=2903782 RepID=UPI002253FB69|nr:hypothetical protein [Streptomyces sp. NBC_01221]MCX4792516.1 hypothetical protein [Streptomyces sp. NBC_01221]